MPDPIQTPSSADAQPSKVEMYSSMLCPFCMMAKRLLAHKGVEYEHFNVDGDPAKRQEMMQRSGRHTVPQIFINNVSVGGFDDIAALDARGELDAMLEASSSAG